MKTWTPDASEHFETWLGRVRTSVSGDPTVDPDDVAQDLRAHVHAELEAVPEPVTVGELERVLDSLGTPAQWSVTTKEQPKERLHVRLERDVVEGIRVIQKRLASDWGSPLLLGIITLAGMLTLYDGGVIFLMLAYFVARSQVTYAPETVVGRKRWPVYTPLAIGAGALTTLLLFFPLILDRGRPFQAGDMWVLGLWWMFVGFVAAREVKRVRALLKPFADGFDRTHARMLMLLGVAIVIAATLALFPRWHVF
jgi:hypothetical protein